jgi:hypothetical protein
MIEEKVSSLEEPQFEATIEPDLFSKKRTF